MPIPGMAIHACSESEVFDLLDNSAQFQKIEVGVVVENQFGLGVNRKGGLPLFHSQVMNAALTELRAEKSSEVVIFFKKDGNVVGPTEVGLATTDVVAKLEKENARKSFDLGFIKPGPVWF